MKKILILSFIITTSYILASQPVIHRPPIRAEIKATRDFSRDAPHGDEIINPAEFGRTDGIFLAWSGWDTQLIADIAYPVSQEYTIFMIVADSYAETQAFNFLQNQDVNMDNVFFLYDINVSNTSMWIRDYAPFFIKEDGVQAIDDFFYGVYQGDDLISYTIADTFDLTIYDSPLIHHGGNHISDGNGMGFFSTNIYNYNTSFTQEEVNMEFQTYFGLDSLIVIEPMGGDGTGHIDMFCKLLSDTLFIVGEYDIDTPCYPGDRELLNNLAEYLSTLSNLDGRPFNVERIPMPEYIYGGPAGTINYTYTNSLIVNDLVLVPVYGFDLDEEALLIYEELMPEHEVIPVNSSFIIQYWGAVHCVVNEYFSENPLIILHEKIEQIESGDSPSISFRLNPKFAESYASVFYKLDSASDFTELSANLQNGIWTSQFPEITENFEYYISGTSISGDYEFSTTLPEIAPGETFYVTCSEVETDQTISNPILSFSNYPNPFNPSTEIRFNLSGFSELESIEIEIYNLKGQKVKTLPVTLSLVEGPKGINYNFPRPSTRLRMTQAGNSEFTVTWNGDNNFGNPVSSGIYFYRLNINNKTEAMRKCLLLK
jgi:agmatine deiminase